MLLTCLDVGQQSPQKADRQQGLGHAGNPSHRFDVHGMEGEDGGSKQGDGGVIGKLACEKEDQNRGRQVHQDGGQVPAGGVQSEELVVTEKPQQEKGPIVVTGRVERGVTPYMKPEIVGHEASFPDEGVGHDLRLIIVNELEIEGAQINDEGCSQDENQQKDWAALKMGGNE